MDSFDMDALRWTPNFKVLYVLSKNDLKKGLIPIPSEKVYPTHGSCNCMSNLSQEPKSRTVCILFQNRSCHEGYKCHQVHVHRTYWKMIEERDYFSPAQHQEEDGPIIVMYREKGKSISSRPIKIPAESVYITKGSESYYLELRKSGESSSKEICNYFHKKTCNYRYNCNQVHIDLDIWKKYVSVQKRGKVEDTEDYYLCSNPPESALDQSFGNPLSVSSSTSSGSAGTESFKSSLSTPDRAIRRRANSSGLSKVRPGNCDWASTPHREPRSRSVFGTALLSFRDELWNSFETINPRPCTTSEILGQTFSDSSSSRSLFSVSGDSEGSVISSGEIPDRLDTSLGKINTLSIWAKFGEAEAKIKRVDQLDDIADLRDRLFRKFTFPKGIVETSLEIWYKEQKLDLRSTITESNLTNGDCVIIKICQG